MAPMLSFVRCKILPGLFDTEVYVVVRGSSAYVSLSDVELTAGNDKALQEGKEVDGFVRAYVVDEEPQSERALIELTGEPVIGGLRTWVPRAQLRPA